MKQLSYSSATLLSNCEERYAHRKIRSTKIDSDASNSTEAFDVGKAFHQVLEDTLHSRTDIDKNVDSACTKYNVQNHKGLIHGMVLSYLDMHELSGLDCLLCEFEINEPTTIGYIDVIMGEPNGDWWIVDLKTSARWNETILSRLPKDYQLNLYASFKERLADILELDLKRFKGCRYRVTTKSKAKQKAKETYEDYVQRIRKVVSTYDVIIPVEAMDIEGVAKIHQANYTRASELFSGATPKRNLSYCESYFRPCEFFSQCHGKNFTQSKNRVQIKNANIYRSELADLDDL